MKTVCPSGLFIALLCLGLVVLSPSTAFTAEHKTLTIANSNWAPYKGEDLPDGGVASDITKQALKRAGYDFKEVFVAWKRALRGANIGTYDILPATWYTAERAIKLQFSKPILSSRTIIISRKDKPVEYRSLEDLKGPVVGVSPGWAYPKAFNEAEGINKSDATDLEANIRRLLRGRIDMVIAEELAARFTAHHKFPDQEGDLHYSTNSLEDKFLHVGFSRKRADYQDIANAFNQALEQMKADGTYHAILLKHGVARDHE